MLKKKSKSKLTKKGFFAILGGFIAHMQLGCLFIWGNIQSYVVTYFRAH
jgi:hypothetical protein